MEADPTNNQSPLSKQLLQSIFKEDSVSVTINQAHNLSCSLYPKDYQSLLPQKWLRTQAIDIIMKLLLEAYLTQISKIYASRGQIAELQHRQQVKMMDAFVVTMLMTYDEESILQSLAPLELFSQKTECLLIPINTENAYGSHWILGCFLNGKFKGRETEDVLVMFDSGQSDLRISSTLKTKLQNLYQVLTGKSTVIQLKLAENIPHQTNNFDCGIYTIGYGQYVMKEIVNKLEEQSSQLRLDRLTVTYKYLLGNSSLTRQRYRKMLQQLLISSHKSDPYQQEKLKA